MTEVFERQIGAVTAALLYTQSNANTHGSPKYTVYVVISSSKKKKKLFVGDPLYLHWGVLCLHTGHDTGQNKVSTDRWKWFNTLNFTKIIHIKALSSTSVTCTSTTQASLKQELVLYITWRDVNATFTLKRGSMEPLLFLCNSIV